MSEWLKLQAEKSDVLLGHKIDKIYNNIVINNFKFVNKDEARNSLNIKQTKKLFYLELRILKVPERDGIYY